MKTHNKFITLSSEMLSNISNIVVLKLYKQMFSVSTILCMYTKKFLAMIKRPYYSKMLFLLEAHLIK